MRMLLMIGASLALAGCQTAAESSLEILSPTAMGATQTAALKEGVRHALKDPGSAQFGDIKAGTNAKGGTVACGWVNAKNSYGGYTGMQPYLALYLPDTGKFYVQAMGGDGARTQAILSVCARQGLALSVL